MKRFYIVIIFIITHTYNTANTATARAKKVFVTGAAQASYFISYKNGQHTLPKSGQKITINNPTQTLYPCGGAINVSLGFKRLGYHVTPFFKVGKDEYASIFTKKLASEGIVQDSVVYSQNTGSGFSFILPDDGGDSTLLIHRGANELLEEQEIPYQALNTCDIAYMTPLSGKSLYLVKPIACAAKKYGACVVINPGSEQLCKDNITLLKDSFSFIDIILLNECEAQQLSNSLEISQETQPNTTHFEFTQLCACLLAQGIRIVLITCGDKGAYVVTHAGTYYRPAIETEVVSTMGAGDAFGVGFVATLLEHNSLESALAQPILIERALISGIINSTSVIRFLDANKGLLNKEELMFRLKTSMLCGICGQETQNDTLGKIS